MYIHLRLLYILAVSTFTHYCGQDLGLSTVWDDHLCYLLAPALASYELERSVGVSAGNEEFQDAVRGYVQEGHTFKGFPIQLTHRSPHRAFNTCLRYSRVNHACVFWRVKNIRP